jgi:hypothetical protein
MLSGFGARKAPASEQSAAAPSADTDGTRPQNRSELSLAEIGARLGEDNEKLRNLLIDTGHRIGAIGEVQQAFRSLAEPVNTAIRELDQERIENGKLRKALAELRSATTACMANSPRSKSERLNWTTTARGANSNWPMRNRLRAGFSATNPS